MGKGKESRTPKSSKPSSCIQEIPTTSYPHWSGWSSSMQHPLIPPYGTSAPYPTLYNHGSSSNTKQIANKKSASSPFSPSHFLISAKSGTEGTSDERNENNDQKDFSGSREDDFQVMVVDGANAQSTTIGGTAKASVYEKPISMPKTNCPLPTFVPQVG
ncbi:G-box-binding factor 1-like [Carya illinoinensis]|uniref:G-box-binding factor 1-like n=1 Tax=Carya illinoinensis TaxID=32201 RepID=UPI001C71CFD1|nr:G-box-binding factor 1-like [Carya illinoinensis]